MCRLRYVIQTGGVKSNLILNIFGIKLSIIGKFKYHLYPQKIQKKILEGFNPPLSQQPLQQPQPLEKFTCPICNRAFRLTDNLVPHPNRDCPYFFHQDCLEKYWNSSIINGDSSRYPGDPQTLLSTCLLDSDSD